MLHIINQSPFISNQLQSCLRLLQTGDQLLLIENAVYAALEKTEFSSTIKNLDNSISIYALQADLIARGLIKNIQKKIHIINYAEFVQLTIAHYPVMSWN